MKNRIIGIIILLLVFIPVIYIGGDYYKALISIVGVLALKEMIGLKETKKAVPSFVKLLSFISLVFIILSKFNVDNFSLYIDYRVLSVMFVLFMIPLVIYSDIEKYNIVDALHLLGIVLFIGVVFNLAIFMREYDLKRLIYIIVVSVMTDSFAYIAGNLSGREKLAPKISPKKSIIGFIVGVVFATIVASTFYHVSIDDSTNVLILISVTLFLSVLSQLGDLAFSSIKRYYNRKDFSSIIFGHGGVLDRFDSLMFVLIGYVFFISVL